MPRDETEITPELLLNAYAAGVFPMAEHRGGHTQWIDPRRRGIIPLDRLHVSKSLKKRIRRGEFEVRVDTAFEQVMQNCANRDETWINDEIFNLYVELHHLQQAHSIEYWKDGELHGGLYGIRLGSAFFGESMFSTSPDASKIALVWLTARLRAGQFTLLDTQFITDHLATMGGIEIGRSAYHRRLNYAMQQLADWNALPLNATADEVLALTAALPVIR